MFKIRVKKLLCKLIFHTVYQKHYFIVILNGANYGIQSFLLLFIYSKTTLTLVKKKYIYI